MTKNKLVASDDATLNKSIDYSSLTISQQQKYAYLREHYSDEQARLKLTLLIEPRGENSWKSVNDKLADLLRADPNNNHYNDTLYDNFDIDTLYTSNDIISIVGAVRRDCGLSPYISSLKRNCEHEFWRLFIAEPQYREVCCEDGSDTKTKRLLDGYIPRFRLKPEDN